MNFKDYNEESEFEDWRDKIAPPVKIIYKKSVFKHPQDKFFNSEAWRGLRLRVLNVYGYKCMKCKSLERSPHIDHIRPRSKYPHLALEFDNLQVLCEACNVDKSTDVVDYRPKGDLK